MLNRVGSPKPIETPHRPGQSARDGKRPGPSPHSLHPTGPAPPYDEREEEPRQGDHLRAPEDGRARCRGEEELDKLKAENPGQFP